MSKRSVRGRCVLLQLGLNSAIQRSFNTQYTYVLYEFFFFLIKLYYSIKYKTILWKKNLKPASVWLPSDQNEES